MHPDIKVALARFDAIDWQLETHVAALRSLLDREAITVEVGVRRSKAIAETPVPFEPSPPTLAGFRSR